MGSGFVGLDVERCVELAGLAERTATTVEGIGADVQRWLWLGDLVDVGAVALCGELAAELDQLRRLLSAKAVEMAAAAEGWTFDAGALEADRLLWASLLDDVGAGVELDTADPARVGGVPMSASLAASALSGHVRSLGGDAALSGQDVYDLVEDGSVPVAVRAAALFAYRNPAAFEAMFAGRRVTADGLDDFVAESDALAVVAEGWARFNTRVDGQLTMVELAGAVEDSSGRFSERERAAARWLLEHDVPDAPWRRFDTWTDALVKRQILAEHPGLAVEWLYMAAADPSRVVAEGTWFDDAGAEAWLTTALSSTTDPVAQADLLVRFAGVYQATKPDTSILSIVHDLLDGVSFVDPTQIADAVNTAIYTAEGDYENAAISAAGMVIVFGGGKAIRLTAEQLAKFTAGQADEFLHATLTRMARDGDLTDDVIQRAVTDVATQFDDATARRFRTALEDVMMRARHKEALTFATRPERLAHTFAPRHRLAPLVERFGSREAVVEQMLNHLDGLTPGSGTFELIIDIAGHDVTVRGAVVDHVVKIGTAFVS